MYTKRGLIGKILLGILALVILILIIVGISAYQASQVLTVVKEESTKISTNTVLLAQQKDCSKLNEIENSFGKIENSVSSACKNPVLKVAIGKIQAVPVKCETLPSLKEDFEKKFKEAKTYCDSSGKLNESIMNGTYSEAELRALAQKYGIQL